MEKIYKNKEWLYQKYVNEGLSLTQTGKLCGIGYETIRNWLKKFNILRRPIGKVCYLHQANHCNLSQEAIEWINGELLGDGCLQSCSPYSARVDYGSKYFEYIIYISNILESFGIEQSGKIRKIYHKNMDCYSYRYISRSYIELLPIRKQWYPKGKKIVPKDLKLTPLTCRQWYIGDGCLIHRNKRKPHIGLSTCGFLVSDVKWLTKQLTKIGFIAKRQLSSNTIRFSIYSIKDFINYIGKCPIKCYQYKWNYENK